MLDRSQAIQETLAKGIEQLVGDHAKAAAKTQATVKSAETSLAGVGNHVKTAAEGTIAGLGLQVDKVVKAAVTSAVSDAAKTMQDVLVEAVKGVVNKKLEEIKAFIVALVDKCVREAVAESTKGLKADIVSMVRGTTRQAFNEAGFAALPSVFGAATALACQGGGGGAGGKHPRGDDGSDTHGGMVGDIVHSKVARLKRSKAAGGLEQGVGDVPSKQTSRAEGDVAPLHIDLTLGTPVGRADGRANIGASLPTLAGRGGVEQTGVEGAVQGAAPRAHEVPGGPQGDVHDFLAGMRAAMETGQQHHPVDDQGLEAIRAGLHELQPVGDHHAHAHPQRPVASTPAAGDDAPASGHIPPKGHLSFPPDLFDIQLGEANTYAEEWQAGPGNTDVEGEEYVENEENEEEDTEGLQVLGAAEGDETDGTAGGALAEVEGGRSRKGPGVRKDRNSPGWTGDIVGGGRSRYLGHSLKREDVEFTVPVAMIVWDGYVSKSGGLDFQAAMSLAVGAIAANAEARDMKAAVAYGVTIASTVAAAWYLDEAHLQVQQVGDSRISAEASSCTGGRVGQQQGGGRVGQQQGGGRMGQQQGGGCMGHQQGDDRVGQQQGGGRVPQQHGS
ncbi:unnamed protein product [Closterium sp. NIES-64]|nr:unnamed protein product [Closterium sp. NIES-64]